MPRFTDAEARKANRAFVDLVTRMAERKKLHRLEENLAAAAVELTADDLREIEDAQIEAHGARYAEANQRMIDR